MALLAQGEAKRAASLARQACAEVVVVMVASLAGKACAEVMMVMVAMSADTAAPMHRRHIRSTFRWKQNRGRRIRHTSSGMSNTQRNRRHKCLLRHFQCQDTGTAADWAGDLAGLWAVVGKLEVVATSEAKLGAVRVPDESDGTDSDRRTCKDVSWCFRPS